MIAESCLEANLNGPFEYKKENKRNREKQEREMENVNRQLRDRKAKEENYELWNEISCHRVLRKEEDLLLLRHRKSYKAWRKDGRERGGVKVSVSLSHPPLHRV